MSLATGAKRVLAVKTPKAKILPLRMWAVVSPRGRMLGDTVSPTRDGAIWLYLVCCEDHHPDSLRAPGATTHMWRGEQAWGFRVVKVNVEVAR